MPQRQAILLSTIMYIIATELANKVNGITIKLMKKRIDLNLYIFIVSESLPSILLKKEMEQQNKHLIYPFQMVMP